MPPEPIKTSFIPKQSLNVERREVKSKSPFALVSAAATLILVVAIAGAGGIFLYKQYLVQSIKGKQQSLDKARSAFEPATIKELARVDARLAAGTELVGNHVAVTALFDEIEARTLGTVRFGDFSFGATAPGRYMVSMSGVARSFNAVAQQSDAFSNSLFFKNPVYSNLNLDQVGNVTFSFAADVDMSRLRYVPGAGGAATAPEIPAPGTDVSTTTP